MTKPFDPSKPVQTQDGRKARIICTDFKSRSKDDYSIIAIITNSDGTNIVRHFDHMGRYPCPTITMSLVNIPEKTVTYRNVYASARRARGGPLFESGRSHETLKDAVNSILTSRKHLGVSKVTYVYGVPTRITLLQPVEARVLARAQC